MNQHNRNHAVILILKAIRSNIPVTVGMLLTVALSIAMAILPPLVLEEAVNLLSDTKLIPLGLALLYFGLLALSGIFDALMEAAIAILGQRINHVVRLSMEQKLKRLPASYFAKAESGQIASRIVNDVNTLEQLFTSGVVSMFADCCKLIGILAVVFYKSKGLGILLILITPLLIILVGRMRTGMKQAQYDYRVSVGQASKTIPETLHNTRTIHVFHMQKFLVQRYERILKLGFDAMERSNFYDAVFSPIISVISGVIIATMMILAVSGTSMQAFFSISVGTAVAIISYVGKIFEPIEAIGMEIQSIASAGAGIQRINAYMDEPEMAPCPPADGNMEDSVDRPHTAKDHMEGNQPDSTTVVSVEDVSFAYKCNQPILSHLSFQVIRGEHVTITGRTGCGKSTLFKLLLGLYQPDEGRVLLFEHLPQDMPEAMRRSKIGYVEQGIAFVDGTLRDQITLHDASITDAMVEHAINSVGLLLRISALPQGLDTPAKQGVFSEGEMQLLSIARAIVRDPELLLLDEITAKLDSDTEVKLMEALKTVSEGRTILSISHRVYRDLGAREISLPTIQNQH